MDNWFTKLAGQIQRNCKHSKEMSEVDALPFQLEKKSGLLSSSKRLYVVHQLKKSIENQINILRRSLNVNSVVLLWPGLSSVQFTTYAYSSQYTDLVTGPFPAGFGIIGALKNQNEISLVPYHASSPDIPYYPSNIGVGSFFAQRLPDCYEDERKTAKYGVLCVDRLFPDQWSFDERDLISITVKQIQHNLFLSRDLLLVDFERCTFQQSFDGLRKLNSALDLKSVYCAADEALRLVVDADAFAISLTDGDFCELCYVSGNLSEKITQRKFLLDDSLVGLVIKYRKSLPEVTAAVGQASVVNGLQVFNMYDSVLVVPLLLEDRPVTGVLIIAARKAGLFTYHCREIIEIIAAQVAIKIDLACAHEQINQMTLTDTLTGIANRRAFQRGFAAMYERAMRRTGLFSLILCDIDYFKRINDAYGHPFGDQVIQQIARQLNDVVRSGDLAARIGGEEFAVLLEDTGRIGALEVAERLREKVEKILPVFNGDTVPVTISLGIAAFPMDTDNQEKLFSYADQALYNAKENGRNRSVCWNDIV